MKFNIGGANVEEEKKSFYPKSPFRDDLKQKKCIFSLKETKKFNIYTSYIKLHCMVFSEQF